MMNSYTVQFPDTYFTDTDRLTEKLPTGGFEVWFKRSFLPSFRASTMLSPPGTLEDFDEEELKRLLSG
jgi:hypothetical protein